MIERLEAIHSRFIFLTEELMKPEIISDIKKTLELTKEQANLQDADTAYMEYKNILKAIEDAKEMLKDEEMGLIAKEELEILTLEKEKKEKELEILLLPKDPNDGKNVIVEIRGAAGGDEANIFAGDLFRMYTRYFEKQNWKYEILNEERGEAGGFSQIEFKVKGKDVYSKLKYESGAHRVQRVPETESALHEAEEQKRRAEQANTMKTMFIQNMSHEIRTPLNSIVGFTQILADQQMDLEETERKEFSQIILHNSELLTTLVDDLLALSELESGKYEIINQQVHCNVLCRETLATVDHRCPSHVRLRFTSEVGDDFTVTTDGRRVREVLVNLLVNAEKFTEKGEIRLHLSLTEHPGRLTFSVTDTGRGIPAGQAEEIFKRFTKLDTFVQGNGLGLSICRLIADCLHAEIKVDTAYTEGARFVFILPL